jgi:hypothetical protein
MSEKDKHALFLFLFVGFLIFGFMSVTSQFIQAAKAFNEQVIKK